MAQSPVHFAITVDERDAVTVVHVSGEMDLATADRLVAAVRELPTAPHPVLFGLEGVSFVDSSGMRALLEAKGIIEEQGRLTGLLRPSAVVTRLLDLVELRDKFVEVDEPDADSLATLG